MHQNCTDGSFGHCDFALELFDFFNQVGYARISSKSQDEYECFQKEFKQRQFEYKCRFYSEIYEYRKESLKIEKMEYLNSTCSC